MRKNPKIPKNALFKNLKKSLLFILGHTLWVLTVIIGCQFILSLIAKALDFRALSPVQMTIFTAIYYTISLLLIIFIPKGIKPRWRTHREELGLSGAPTWTDIGLAPIGFAVSILLIAMLNAFFSLFPWYNITETQNVGYHNLINIPERLAAFIALVILAPIMEEVIFRGWLYGRLRAKLCLPTAMIIVSLLFGLVHGQWNVGITTFAMSLVLCGLREITGTIYSGIILHMIKNAIAFLFLFIISNPNSILN